MNLHEYQAKNILKRYGIPVPEALIVSSVEEARAGLAEKDWNRGVIKVQVHAGGRGKAGGVQFGNTRDEILTHVENLLGLKVVNNQTGPEGMVADKVLISPPVSIKKEYYLGAVIDRKRGQAMIVGSPEGGMEIEEIAQTKPERLTAIPIQLNGSLRTYHLIQLAKVMGWEWNRNNPALKIARELAKAFVETDASLLEINPLVETVEGNFTALDAKLSVDDNALFRQGEIAQYYDPSQVPLPERKANRFELAYIAMEGNIGCMVNGAGLAMATMDIIKHYGGTPANFLDVGGGADRDKVAAAFKIILSDPHVKAILINIFGGIMNCGTLADGIVAAAGEQQIGVPLIVRMEGTNVDEGKRILRESKLNIITADDLTDAAQKAVNAAKGEH
ncbi:MAG: ADP-forming succinate--CoA ligase subunit beta [Chlamydiales bacterium]